MWKETGNNRWALNELNYDYMVNLNLKLKMIAMRGRQDDVDFDKKEWVRLLKQLKKDLILEDRERTRPLLTLKRDLKDFYDDFEKEDKKLDIALKKEQA